MLKISAQPAHCHTPFVVEIAQVVAHEIKKYLSVPKKVSLRVFLWCITIRMEIKRSVITRRMTRWDLMPEEITILEI